MRKVYGAIAAASVACVANGLLPIVAGAAPLPSSAGQLKRTLYAVNQAPGIRGSISVYDIDNRHRLIKTIRTVAGVRDVKGVVASAVTGRLYVSYLDASSAGHIYCLDIGHDRILWDRKINPGVDRLAISPDGRLLFVPTWEGRSADFINVVDAENGRPVRKVHFSNHSHDAQYPLSGPLFQETKAEDGSGRFLYKIDPRSYAVSRVGPFADILGPYAVDSSSHYVVANVTHLWGMEVADLKTGKIVTARPPTHPSHDSELLHGIGWTPDQSEVWETGPKGQMYVFDMRRAMAPRFKQIMKLKTPHRAHWLTFSIKGDFAYIALTKNSDDETEVFSVASHRPVGSIGSSEDMLEIDFRGNKIVRTGDQFGIGRKRQR